MTQKQGITLSLILLFVSSVVFLLLSSHPICFESPQLESVEIISTEGRFIVNRCSLKESTPYSEKAAGLIEELNRRMLKLDYAINEIGVWRRPIRLSILDGEFELDRANAESIFLDKKSFLEGIAFERHFWRAWLAQNTSSRSISSPFVNILLFYSNAESIVENGQVKTGVVARALMRAFKSLSNKERFELLKDIVALAEIFSVEEGGEPSLAQIVQEVGNLARSLSAPGGLKYPELFEKLKSRFVEALAHQGWEQDRLRLNYFFLIEHPQLVDSRLDLHVSHQRLLISDGKTHFLLPFDQPLGGDLKGSIESFYGIWSACHEPSLAKVKEFPVEVKKLLVIINCGDPSKIKWQGFVKNGLTAFASDNPEIRFVEIHMPSLANFKANEKAGIFELLGKSEDHLLRQGSGPITSFRL